MIPESGFRQCSQILQKAQGGTNVFQFKIQGNPYIFVGTDNNIVSANSFFATDGNGGSPKPPGGTVSATSSDSSDSFQITQGSLPTAKVTTPDQSASDLDRTLTFKYTVFGTGSASQAMKVTARQFAWVTNNSPSNTCTLGYGWLYDYVYTPFTHPDGEVVPGGGLLTGTPTHETFNPPTIACGNQPGPGALDANSQFQDTIELCSTQPIPTCSSTNTQTLDIAGYQVRTNSLTIANTGLSYTSEGPTK